MDNLIGEKIKSFRLSKSMTQKQLGDKCGINEANIRKYELGKANPKISTLEKIATALDVSVQSIIGWDETQPAETNLKNMPSDLVFDPEDAPVHLSAKQILDVNWNLTFTSSEYSLVELQTIKQFAEFIKDNRGNMKKDE